MAIRKTQLAPMHDCAASSRSGGPRLGEVELRSELESAIQELRTARATTLSVEQEQLRLAAAVRDSLNQSFEAGKTPLIDMLDAQRDYRDTYRLYITNRADYWRALYKFNAAVGEQLVK